MEIDVDRSEGELRAYVLWQRVKNTVASANGTYLNAMAHFSKDLNNIPTEHQTLWWEQNINSFPKDSRNST
jgi:hypothetical protein